jgi:hypothetical protein
MEGRGSSGKQLEWEDLLQLSYKERSQRITSLKRIRGNSSYLMRTTRTPEDGKLDRSMQRMFVIRASRMDSNPS